MRGKLRNCSREVRFSKHSPVINSNPFRKARRSLLIARMGKVSALRHCSDLSGEAQQVLRETQVISFPFETFLYS